jgi:tetratricopeptide (TPR) repeat protein
VRLSEELGINAYLALWTAHLGEGLLVAGRLERAHTVAQRALDLARAHHEAGHEAWAQWLLGEIAVERRSDDGAPAEAHYRNALALAEELGLRPLVARIHLGLARLARQRGDGAAAETALARATTDFCEMDMRFWAQVACAELGALGNLVVVAREQQGLYDYLSQVSAKDDRLLVILDRRQGDRRQQASPDTPERRRRGDRRANTRTEELARRGFVIIGEQPATPESPREPSEG